MISFSPIAKIPTSSRTSKMTPFPFCRATFTPTSGAVRRRSLLAAVSPKHERLSALLAAREYDEIDIITPGGQSPRANLARAAAAVSATAQHVRGQSDIDSNYLFLMIHYLFDRHADAYTRGLNVEISLTGSR